MSERFYLPQVILLIWCQFLLILTFSHCEAHSTANVGTAVSLPGLAATASTSKSYVRGCYFTNWSQYRGGNGKYTPERYVPGLCTHMMYAFLWMQEDFTVKAFEWNDESTEWSKGQYEKVTDLKKVDPQLKVLLSLGGWTFGGRLFTAMSSSAANRKVFLSSLIPFVRKFGFDGFDLDWEYPITPGDQQRYLDLLMDVKEAFEEEANRTGKPRLLFSAAVSAGEATIKSGYNISEVAKYLDLVFVMSYDFHGSWEQETGHNSPLYGRTGETGWVKTFNTDYALRYWASQGMPKEKLIVGIATYGRGWTLKTPVIGAPGMGAATQSPSKPTAAVRDAGYAAYFEICDMIKTGGVRYWQVEQQVPYLIKGDQWFGYDDQVSIRNKMRWLKREGFGGAFVWTLDFDDFGAFCAAEKFPLINVLKDELAGPNINQVEPVVANGSLPTGYDSSPDNESSTSGGSVSPTAPPPVPAIPSTAAPLNSLCTQLTDGFHAYDQDCSKFLLCLKSRASILTCPEGLFFNAQLKYCTEKDTSGCTMSLTTPASGGSTQHDEVCTVDGFFRKANDCSKFYQCVNKLKYDFDCPANLYFNTNTKSCDYKDKVTCN